MAINGGTSIGTCDPLMRFGPEHPQFPSIAEMVRISRGRDSLPNLRVHDHDDMFAFGEAVCDTPAIATMAYFRAGLVIADTFRQIIDGWCGAQPSAVLDFACGYGRSLRYTVADFGDSVWASDILPDAVDFVREEFGAHAFASETNPEQLRCDTTFDVVFVSSLFTHLPRHTFTRWLRRLHGLLWPDGLLVISVHDEFMLPPGASLADGFYFQPTTEVESLDTADYGATVVNEHFVRMAIEAATGHVAYRRFATALCFEQDLYAVPADPGADLARLRVHRGPEGAFEDCEELESGEWVLRGWAATQDDEPVEKVEIYLGGALIASVEPADERPYVAAKLRTGRRDALYSGWRASVRLGPTEPDTTVLVKATTSDAISGVIWCLRAGDMNLGHPAPAPVQSKSMLRRVRDANNEGGPRAVARSALRWLSRLGVRGDRPRPSHGADSTD
jgi:2-polyprenyl-3-methyl-5-hydroxy-6-metoxy-1,4-benzoquinol methylase